MIRAVIVDDERNAIESLTWELNKYCPDVQILDTFTNPVDAISAINYLKPDLVFLDIQMPEIDGFQLLQRLTFRDFDLVITTAYNQYALQAFKEDAIDYLLKPYDPEDLIKAVEKANKNKKNNNLGSNIEKVIDEVLAKDLNKSYRIPLALSDKVVMVDTEDIIYCKSDGNYTYVFMSSGKNYFLSKSIKVISKLIPDTNFLRVHKSYLVNIKYISEYIRGDGGELILSNNQNIPVSRTNKLELLKALHIK